MPLYNSTQNHCHSGNKIKNVEKNYFKKLFPWNYVSCCFFCLFVCFNSICERGVIWCVCDAVLFDHKVWNSTRWSIKSNSFKHVAHDIPNNKLQLISHLHYNRFTFSFFFFFSWRNTQHNTQSIGKANAIILSTKMLQ